jgi:hypothetical protein
LGGLEGQKPLYTKDSSKLEGKDKDGYKSKGWHKNTMRLGYTSIPNNKNYEATIIEVGHKKSKLGGTGNMTY